MQEQHANDSVIRSLVNGYYDTSKLRIATGNRLIAAVKYSLGILETQNLDELSEEDREKAEAAEERKAQKLFKQLTWEYCRIADAIATKKRAFNFDKYVSQKQHAIELIGTRAQYGLMQSYELHRENEAVQLKVIEDELKNHKIYTEFLRGVNGCGPLMSAVIISYFDFEKSNSPASFWKFAGLDVAPDGRGRGRWKEHLVETEYKSSDGEIKTKVGLSFQPFLKTKMLGVLGTSFLRIKSCQYREFYYSYKDKLLHEIECGMREPLRPIVIHRRAMRYMIKRFLKDLWRAYRDIRNKELEKEALIAANSQQRLAG